MSSQIQSPEVIRWFGPGELARLTNTSIKALRVYEKAGLIAPDRREGGWRLYGPAHVERLHHILALKALGLSLKQIGETLHRGGLEIGQMLDLQARQLASDIRSAQAQLQRVQRARGHLAEHGEVPPDLLLELARSSAPARPIELKEIRAVIEAGAQDEGARKAVLAVLKECPDGEAMEARIGELLTEASIAAAQGNPRSPDAADLADRWLALASTLDLQVNDTDEATALEGVVAHMIADPRLADTLLFLRAAVEGRAVSKKKG